MTKIFLAGAACVCFAMVVGCGSDEGGADASNLTMGTSIEGAYKAIAKEFQKPAHPGVNVGSSKALQMMKTYVSKQASNSAEYSFVSNANDSKVHTAKVAGTMGWGEALALSAEALSERIKAQFEKQHDMSTEDGAEKWLEQESEAIGSPVSRVVQQLGALRNAKAQFGFEAAETDASEKCSNSTMPTLVILDTKKKLAYPLDLGGCE